MSYKITTEDWLTCLDCGTYTTVETDWDGYTYCGECGNYFE